MLHCVIAIAIFALMLAMMSRSTLYHLTIGCLWCLLEGVNIPLAVASTFFFRLRGSSTDDKPRVVIVGASFAGLAAWRHLHNKFRVTLIDFKEYFEYTPGILRAFVEPESLSTLTCPLDRPNFLCGEVSKVTGSQVHVSSSSGEATIPYDYLMIGSGSLYHGPIKPTPREPTLDKRTATWKAAAGALAEVQRVLIIGGGPVGVELAGEIVTQYPDKHVTIVDALPKICASFPANAIQHMTNWLQNRGVKLVLGEWIESITEQGCVLKSGLSIQADITYRCMGFKPNSGLLAEEFADQLTDKGSLMVEHTLQVKDYPRIFGMGDVCIHNRSAELKLGHTAELNAHLAAINMERHHSQAPLLEYPNGIVGCAVSPKVYCISLGKYDGVLIFNSIVLYGFIGGFIAAVVKWLLEWTKVAAAANRTVGVLFWEFADLMSIQISRWILPLKDPKYKTHSIIMFDGDCALCDGFVRLVIHCDPVARFKFCPLQSNRGKELLATGGLDPNDMSSMVLVDEYGYHRQSTAALRVLYHCGWWGRLLYGLILIPAPIRNLGYKLVAANRYTLFGKLGKCAVSAAQVSGRVIDATKDS